MIHREVNIQSHIHEIAEVLQRAFFDDPFYGYVLPNPKKRAAQLNWFMTCMARYGGQHGQVYTTAEPISGAAIWLPPDAPLPDRVKMARAGTILAPFRLGIGGYRRLAEAEHEWDDLHRQEAARHWYLMFLGVEPGRQGQGMGGSLLQPVLEQADQAALPCYLETATTRNVSFYRKHGFDIVVEGQMRNGAPYWTMRRPPREPAGEPGS